MGADLIFEVAVIKFAESSFLDVIAPFRDAISGGGVQLRHVVSGESRQVNCEANWEWGELEVGRNGREDEMESGTKLTVRRNGRID